MEQLNTMKAILIQADKSLTWTDVPEPILKDNHIVIKVNAAALNRADLLQRDGLYPSPPEWPDWMGLEASGEVIEANKDSRWKVGNKVCALLGGGGYAEKVLVPDDMVMSVPDNLSMIEAAGIPEVFATAYLNLFIEGEMKKGDTVFVQAGASGLGVALIQLAKRFGAKKIITTVGSEEKAQFVRELGADVVINRKTENISEVLAKHPADVAIDCVAGPNLGACLATMAHGGRWVVLATLGGVSSELNMLDFFKRGVKLIGSTLRSRTNEMKGDILSKLENDLWPAFSSGELKVFIHKTLPMTQAEEAHAILQRQENIGKVVMYIK